MSHPKFSEEHIKQLIENDPEAIPSKHFRTKMNGIIYDRTLVNRKRMKSYFLVPVSITLVLLFTTLIGINLLTKEQAAPPNVEDENESFPIENENIKEFVNQYLDALTFVEKPEYIVNLLGYYMDNLQRGRNSNVIDYVYDRDVFINLQNLDEQYKTIDFSTAKAHSVLKTEDPDKIIVAFSYEDKGVTNYRELELYDFNGQVKINEDRRITAHGIGLMSETHGKQFYPAIFEDMNEIPVEFATTFTSFVNAVAASDGNTRRYLLKGFEFHEEKSSFLGTLYVNDFQSNVIKGVSWNQLSEGAYQVTLDTQHQDYSFILKKEEDGRIFVHPDENDDNKIGDMTLGDEFNIYTLNLGDQEEEIDKIFGEPSKVETEQINIKKYYFNSDVPALEIMYNIEYGRMRQITIYPAGLDPNEFHEIIPFGESPLLLKWGEPDQKNELPDGIEWVYYSENQKLRFIMDTDGNMQEIELSYK